MGLLIIFLEFIVVLDCLFLALLILIQLPKKEAGAGQAFGGGATDALFGAGSGNALTKLTKYAAGIFLALALLLSVLVSAQAKQRNKSTDEELKKLTGARTAAVAPTNATSSTLPPVTNKPMTLESPTVPATNSPVIATNKSGAATNPLSAPNPGK